jgi:hypothetical protein
MDKAGGDGGSGGGGGGDKTEIEKLKEENDRLKKEGEASKTELEKLRAAGTKPAPGTKEEDDLREKARKEKEASEELTTKTKRMEGAIKFNMGIAEFVKTNKDILPEEIQQILKTAANEKYDTEVDRAAAVKAGIIQAFFSIAKNEEALTTNQREALKQYLSLTKKAKEEKAPDVYENIFEPAIETLKKIRKAEELAKGSSGHTVGTNADQQYKDKLVKASRETYLGEKGS